MKIQSLLIAGLSLIMMGSAVANYPDDEQRQKYNQACELNNAISNKNHAEAKRMLDLGYQNYFGLLTLVVSACGNGDDVMLDLLLSYATKADKETLSNEVNWNYTPMRAAARAKSYTCIQKLLDFGITPDKQSAENLFADASPLAEAVANNDTKCARLLLQHGARMSGQSLYETNYEHNGGLVIDAAFRGHLEVLKLLLDYGADANSKNSNNESAIDFAQAMGHKNCVALLREKGAQDPKRLTPYSLTKCRQSKFYKGRKPNILDYILDSFR